MFKIIVKSHQQRRRYSLEINDENQIIVKTPVKPSQRIIDRLLSDHDKWIKKQLSKKIKADQTLSQWHDPNFVHYRGRFFEIKQEKKNSVQFFSDYIVFPLKQNKNQFLINQAKLYLPERCLDIAENMGLTTGKISVRRMRSCWGTCHRNQNITLNAALIQAPDWVIDYVIIHECAHLVHFNHSKDFWGLVDQFTELKKKSKAWLKQHQSVLMKMNLIQNKS